jgi:hypothetical protein
MTDFAYAWMIIREMVGRDNWKGDQYPQITQITQNKVSRKEAQKAQ